jgi:hypothetical protein
VGLGGLAGCTLTELPAIQFVLYLRNQFRFQIFGNEVDELFQGVLITGTGSFNESDDETNQIDDELAHNPAFLSFR